MEILQHLPNGGAVAAVIIVVVLFHKQQEKQQDRYDARMEAMATRFMMELVESRKAFIERLDVLLGLKRPHDRMHDHDETK